MAPPRTTQGLTTTVHLLEGEDPTAKRLETLQKDEGIEFTKNSPHGITVPSRERGNLINYMA